ncbi:hypothetical protein MRX96_003178 [Rhipicephalus microplus]
MFAYFNKNTIVLAYWADEYGHGENFYPAMVTALADFPDTLVVKLKASRNTLPRVIIGKLGKDIMFDDSDLESQHETVDGVPPNEEKRRAYDDKTKNLENEIWNLKEEVEKYK